MLDNIMTMIIKYYIIDKPFLIHCQALVPNTRAQIQGTGANIKIAWDIINARERDVKFSLKLLNWPHYYPLKVQCHTFFSHIYHLYWES